MSRGFFHCVLRRFQMCSLSRTFPAFSPFSVQMHYNYFHCNSSFWLIALQIICFASTCRGHFGACGAIGNAMQISIRISYTFGGVFLDLERFLGLVCFRAHTSQFFPSKYFIWTNPNSKWRFHGPFLCNRECNANFNRNFLHFWGWVFSLTRVTGFGAFPCSYVTILFVKTHHFGPS